MNKSSNTLIKSIPFLFALFLVLASVKIYAENQQRYHFTTSDDYKFVWFRVPKVGSQSIFQIFQDSEIPISINAHERNLPFNPVKYGSYFKFAFVRNPWSRVVSCYLNKIVREKKRPYFKECFDKDFEFFVDFLDGIDLDSADIHIRLQTALIPLEHIDFIGRFENFSTDLKSVLSLLGINNKNIPHRNQTNHLHYSTYYNERTKEIIARKYKDDIDAFGYVFETEF